MRLFALIEYNDGRANGSWLSNVVDCLTMSSGTFLVGTANVSL